MDTDANVLMDEICDHLEAIANLVYLLEGDAGDRAKVLDYGRLLTDELCPVIAAAHKHLGSGFCFGLQG